MIIMLIQFTAGNYASIRDEITLSMVAGKGKEHEEILIPFNKEKILPSAAIFGANAAGKTNIQKAMTAAILFIRNSNTLQVGNLIPLMIPFLMDDDHKNKPCFFDFIFTVNGIKYQYGFSADSKSVKEEYLYKYNSSRPTTIFERTNTSNYDFKTNESKLRKYVEKNTENKLFLSTATMWNCELTKEPFMWFINGIDTYSEDTLKQAEYQEIVEGDSSTKSFINKLLSNADINIIDYNVDSNDISSSDIPKELLPMGLPIQEDTVFKKVTINTFHMVGENGDEKIYQMPFESESEGTKRLFIFAPLIKKALENGSTMMVDEIDSSFHPVLLNYLISIFNNRSINKNGAQLIFNTQSLTQMSLDILRRDQIYFVEKNLLAASDLYSLDDFSPRKEEDIRKRYLQGRYGAIPTIKEGELF